MAHMRYAAVLCGLALCFPSLLRSQNTPVQGAVTREDLPPSAVLQNGLAAFDRIRSDMANWSDIELAAFAATASQAKADCGRIEQTAHEGDEELALAKLCALGRNWDGVYSAARWYTRRSAPAEQATHLPVGYALLLQADLNLQAVERAVNELAEMQERLPYTGETNAIFTYAIEAMEVNRPEYGLRAARLRQPSLLAAVTGSNESLSAGTAEAQAWHTLALLHAAGLANDEASEKQKLMDVLARRTGPATPLDQYLAQQGRTQYDWLGKAPPTFTVKRSTYAVPPRQKGSAAKAVLLVIDSGAAVDVATLSLAVDSLRSRLAPGTEARLVLVEAENGKADTRLPPPHAQFTRDPLLSVLGFETGPVFMTLDSKGLVTWLSTGTPAWLNPQQQAEVLLTRSLSPSNE